MYFFIRFIAAGKTPLHKAIKVIFFVDINL